MKNNTLFIRCEAPLQSWGGHNGSLVTRFTNPYPTKSGIVGLLMAAMKVDNDSSWLKKLNEFKMGIRIDTPGFSMVDYQTVKGFLTGEGKTKENETLETHRHYLADASFLVALQGDSELVETLYQALRKPKRILFLGRKTCFPSQPLYTHAPGDFENLEEALITPPWRWRLNRLFKAPTRVRTIIEYDCNDSIEPERADYIQDTKINLYPPALGPRTIYHGSIPVDTLIPDSSIFINPHSRRKLREYDAGSKKSWEQIRAKRLEIDGKACVVCEDPASEVHHTTYRNKRGQENVEDLRSLCRCCHEAVTMIEYGSNMGLDRIDPLDPALLPDINEKRRQIMASRAHASGAPLSTSKAGNA